MMRTLATLTAGAVVLLALASCSSDPQSEWVNQQFSEERWGAPGVLRAAGGISSPGTETGLDFTPSKPGWYDIGMACEGASSIAVTVTATNSELGNRSTDCGSTATTTVELPASQVRIEVVGAEPRGMWALAVAEAP
jgi:hypothetical protein